MKFPAWLLACALLGVSYTASADRWHTDFDRGYHGHKGKYEYWDGNCKVKREFKKNGRYKEKRDCAPRASYRSSRPSHSHSHSHSQRQYSGVNIPAIIIEPIIRIGR